MKENIRAAKREYYFKTFTAQKKDMKKTWKTIDETLNRRKNNSKFSSEFIVNNRSITDHKEIADQFKNSSGKDEISNKLLKSIKDEIAKPLTIIINQSLKTGIFPEALKIAKVKLLYKKGDNFV